ncbi:hypothetical protein D1007_04885 [Hordeum vulgare]|nr:hypothetical protein D1007_04885 [Hordeum vulgare]
MPLRRRGTSSCRGARVRPYDTFYSEIRSNEMRLSLGMFNTVEEAAHMFDAAAWRLNMPRREMNFPEMELKEASTSSSDDERWCDTFIMMEESDTGASESNDDDDE